MSASDKKSPIDRSDEDSGTFSVQLYSDDGQLLNEYTLDPVKDNVATLCAAEKSARTDMVGNDLGSTIIIVSHR